MIYCIISGEITEIQGSIQALNELLGQNNELLSRKGVDSYRADLQSAVEYLCRHLQVSQHQNYKIVEGEEIKVQLGNKSTYFELNDLG